MGKTHDDDEVEIDLRELYYALKKRVLVILAAVLAGAVIAGAATKLLMTPVYSATSTMLVLTKETTLSSLADLQKNSVCDTGCQNAHQQCEADLQNR